MGRRANEEKMTETIRDLVRDVYRLAVLWVVDVISLLVTAAILPGFEIQAVPT
jgi:hypothetical protein